MLTVLTQMPAFISVNRSERLPTSAGGRLRQSRAVDWLERQRVRSDAWYTTWAILYEFLRVTTHAGHATAMERIGGVEFRCGAARLTRPHSSCPDRTARR